jgi:hypothetical protein
MVRLSNSKSIFSLRTVYIFLLYFFFSFCNELFCFSYIARVVAVTHAIICIRTRDYLTCDLQYSSKNADFFFYANESERFIVKSQHKNHNIIEIFIRFFGLKEYQTLTFRVILFPYYEI